MLSLDCQIHSRQRKDIMITKMASEERGRTRTGWLDSRHSFAFGSYVHPDHLQFGPLRVLNEDRVAPSEGFPAHPHQDMEIITYVLEGKLAHEDSMGHGGELGPGDWQAMTAGTGMTHSERNPSPTNPVHFLQIWIRPRAKGLRPKYADRKARQEEKMVLLASPNGGEGSLSIGQDAFIYRLKGEEGAPKRKLPLDRSEKAWFQLAKGSARSGNVRLHPGDALMIENEDHLEIELASDAEGLWFRLPAKGAHPS